MPKTSLYCLWFGSPPILVLMFDKFILIIYDIFQSVEHYCLADCFLQLYYFLMEGGEQCGRLLKKLQ